MTCSRMLHASIPFSIALSALLSLVTTAQADLVNRYTFNFANVADSVGGQDGELVDPSNIAYYNDGQVYLTNNNGANSNQDFSNPSTVGAYVNLPNGLISSAANNGDFFEFSLEFWATVEENRDWARLGDFGHSNGGEDVSGSGSESDYLIVVPRTGGNIVDPISGNAGNYFAASTHSLTGQEDFVPDPNGPLSTGVEHHIVVSVDQFDTTAGANGTLNLYLDGSLVSTGPVEDEGFVDFTFIQDVNNWLGRAQWGDALFDGSYNEFSVYSHALDATEVANNYTTGPVVDAPLALPTLYVNREDGTISVANDTGAQLNLLGYTITSASGSLDPISWTSIDSGSFDPNGTWTETSSTEMSIGETGTGDGGQIAAMSDQSIGAAWNVSPYEDLVFTYTLASGSSAAGQVVYTGFDGAIAAADLNADGVLDASDFDAFVANVHTDYTVNSSYESFLHGDLDRDGDTDYYDFRLFKDAYVAANGAEAFAALVSGNSAVPEPASVVLLALCLAPLAYRRG
ncbi:LamG domain-containing protein [Aeoliella mucimassa]|uniref:LTD domain-containing protein n=1 Tax=Aeoliella mucimassa TaxID=2527972 RepID=A0A518AS98_9BACT|nr:LamG domain-containing protein [Aeoliella mucimassa]QDU57603.1 hypothetical protein Pan181_38210 [Aeoliella mucimassa]